jgi:uncharacterized protein (TIGR02757 family)
VASAFRRTSRRSGPDPVRLLARYPDPADREVVAFLASGLAFGRVRSVINSIEAVLNVAGPRPSRFVEAFTPKRDASALTPLVHRWLRGEDLVALMIILQRMLLEAGSIERYFSRGLPRGAKDISDALEAFSNSACAIEVPRRYRATDGRPGVAYFFSRPSAGSACKRLNLFLRWMVRRDAIDPGGWSSVSPAQLIVPLDVHVIRVGRCLRLTRYQSPGWAMAADITASLRKIDAADPIKYDFALCHLGMQGSCAFNHPATSTPCPLRGACRPAGRRRPASRQPSDRR